VAAIAISHDEKHALTVEFSNIKVALPGIDGRKITYNKSNDIPVGLWPFNIDIAPDCKLALVADIWQSKSLQKH
jgi:hypothetical protein